MLALAGYRMARARAMTPAAVTWRSRELRRDLHGIDRAVLMGTTFELPRTVPYVTYDDMTVGQLPPSTGSRGASLRPGLPARRAPCETPWAAA